MSDEASYDLSKATTAVLLAVADKYIGGSYPFKLNTLNALQSNETNMVSHCNIEMNNILNKDKSGILINQANTSSVISLDLPVDIANKYPKKYIPVGTRFTVVFTSGDIIKPIIVAGEF